MPSRIIIKGRQIGTGRYGGSPLCLCGESVTILGRCDACHDALRRRRLGLKPNDEAEAKRLDAYMEKLQGTAGRCLECHALGSDEHDPRCVHYVVPEDAVKRRVNVEYRLKVLEEEKAKREREITELRNQLGKGE